MPKNRAAFTLIELLVVIAIIAVLISLLLPAIQKARESASRLQCSNNMKQMGVALAIYQDEYSVFPIGTSGMTEWGGAEDRNAANWRVRLLPYLDQQALFDSLNFSRTFGGHTYLGNEVLKNRVVDTFECPSSWLDTFADLGNNANRGQVHDYVGIQGAAPIGNTADTVPGPPTGYKDCSYGWSCNNGMMGGNEVRAFRDCADGTSSTMIISELNGLMGKTDRRSGYYGGWFGSRVNLTAQNCTTDFWQTGTACVRYRINESNISLAGATQAYANNVPLSSMHVNGVNALMVDGTVHFISQEIDLMMLKRLARREDGEKAAF